MISSKAADAILDLMMLDAEMRGLVPDDGHSTSSVADGGDQGDDQPIGAAT